MYVEFTGAVRAESRLVVMARRMPEVELEKMLRRVKEEPEWQDDKRRRNDRKHLSAMNFDFGALDDWRRAAAG